MRARGYCYTLNNYSQEEVEVLKAIDCKYHVLGYEVGENGTPHIQGYIYFHNKKSLNQLKKINPRIHWEVQKGTFEQAIEYCKKDGSAEELGVAPMSNKRKGEAEKERWKSALESAKKARFDEIDPDIYIRYRSNLRKIAEESAAPPESISSLTNEWYYGDSGTGKSRKAREDHPGAYIKNTNKWWDRYDNEEVVIIEEFSPCHEVLACHLKIWADHYPFQGEIKGGSKLIRPKKIIVTSNYHPSEVFSRDNDLGPILRRFKITHFNKLD